MKRVFLVMVVLLTILAANAQDNKRHGGFTPEKFNAEKLQFIIKEANLTAKEGEKFVPIYNKMLREQRTRFDRMRRIWKNKPSNEAACLEIIKERDKLELELKRIQQSYHNKLLMVIPAQKLFDVIKAEEYFHRHMLKKYGSNPPKKEHR